MRKPHMIVGISLILLATICLGMTAGSETSAEDMVFVSPSDLGDANVGDTVTVSVVLQERVEGLYGFDIMLVWSPTILDYVSHVVMSPVESFSEGVLHEPIFMLKDEVDPTGEIWVACASMWPAEEYNGDGILLSVTFEVLSVSDDKAFELVDFVLADDEGQPIGYDDHEESGPTSTITYDERRTKGRMRSHEGWKKWWLTVVRPHSPCPHPFHHP